MLKGHIPQGDIAGQIADTVYHKAVTVKDDFFSKDFIVKLAYKPHDGGFLFRAERNFNIPIRRTCRIGYAAFVQLLFQSFKFALADLYTFIRLRNRGKNFAGFLLVGFRHLLFVVVNILFGKPFRFFREQGIQFPHFCDLFLRASSPQVLFRPSSGSQIIVAVGT